MQIRASAFFRPAVLAAGAVFLASGLQAQIQVTSITYGSLTNGTDRTNTKITSSNEYRAPSVIDTTEGNYVFSAASGSTATIRRSTASNNNSTVFYQYSAYSGSSTNGTSATVYGQADTNPTLNEVMSSSDLGQGLRNPFANRDAGAVTTTSSNIERIDISLPNFTVTNIDDGIVLFDLENYGSAGDSFRIATYTATGTVNGSSNAPTTYSNTGLLVNSGSFGNGVATPTGGDARYLISSTTSGDNIDVSQTISQVDSSNNGTINSFDLVLVGIVIRFRDLGLNVGDVIQGYSLMASDTVVSSASDLVNWRNSSVYLTNTDSNTSAGDMDFMAFGTQISRYVPEPSTYGLMFSGAACALAGWRRFRRKSAAA